MKNFDDRSLFPGRHTAVSPRLILYRNRKRIQKRLARTYIISGALLALFIISQSFAEGNFRLQTLLVSMPGLTVYAALAFVITKTIGGSLKPILEATPTGVTFIWGTPGYNFREIPWEAVRSIRVLKFFGLNFVAFDVKLSTLLACSRDLLTASSLIISAPISWLLRIPHLSLQESVLYLSAEEATQALEACRHGDFSTISGGPGNEWLARYEQP